MKLLFAEKEEVATPYLAEGNIDIEAFFDTCNELGNPETMISLAMNLDFGFARCKDYARQTFNRHEQKLVYYENGKEYRIYDGFLLKPNRADPAHYGIRVINDILLHIAILPVGDKIEASVVMVEGDNFKVLYSERSDAVHFGNPIAVAVITDLLFAHNGKEISLDPLEIYTQDGNVVMLSIGGKQIINIQVAPGNITNNLDKLISLIPTI